ncbi:ABC transporter substrate-binding protein [Paenibacillus sp. NPDC058071]|uniref:ABC transporter substrate-binding protein n=1 Tax=Paenibacillus sp. NPDC058071 TaxID=3346326 RepID=UPI0036DD2349
MNIKHIKILLLILVLVGLSGCSASKDAAGNRQTEEPVDVVFWHAMSGDLEKTLQQLTERFNATSTDVHIKLVNQGNYSVLQQKLAAAARSGDLPVIAQTYAEWNDEFVQAGLVQSLSLYMEDPLVGWDQARINDIYPAFRAENKWDGRYYSLPFNKSVQILYYNKTMLEAVGISVPSTWEEWNEAARKLTMTKPGGAGKVTGTGFENAIFMELSNYVWQAGGEFFDPSAKQPAFHTPEGYAGVAFVKDMLEEGIARLAGEDQYMSVPFGRGDVAMYVGSSAGIPFVGKAVGDSFEWSTAVLPKGKVSVAYIQGANLTLFNSASEEAKLGAWAYMTYLTESENSAYWSEQTGYLPVRVSVEKLDSHQAFLERNPVQAAAQAQLLAERYPVRVPYATSFEAALGREMEAMLRGRKPIKQGLADAEQTMKEILAKKTESISGDGK